MVFAEHHVEFLAVLQGDRLAGVCARRELTQALGSRFGFALNARRAVGEHLMPAPLRVVIGAPMTEVFKATAARGEREFYDDVLLVDADGRYVGMIPMYTLTRLQTQFLLSNIARVEASRQVIAEKNKRMEDDLRMAREVQFAMLPPPQAPLEFGERTLRLAHRYRPAGDMSGDFFAVLRISDEALGILVCDVMGHGVRSALITAMVRAMLEELRDVGLDPGRLLTRLNRDLTRILRQAGELIFVTAAYAVIEMGAPQMRYAQAGHPTPLRWDAARRAMRPIACNDAVAGPALGLIDDFEFAACTEEFPVGSRVVLFTDGLTEAAQPSGEEFGETRLAVALSRRAGESLEDCLEKVLGEVIAFAGEKFADDVCIVAVELAPGAQVAPSGAGLPVSGC